MNYDYHHRPVRLLCLIVCSFSTAVAGYGIEDDADTTPVWQIREATQKHAGIVAVYDCDNLPLAITLAESGDFFVHVLDSSEADVQAARQVVDAKGLWGTKIVVETVDAGALPYADNTIDLFLSVELTPEQLETISPKEILRVLCPGGHANMGIRPRRIGANELAAWAKQDNTVYSEVQDINGKMLYFRKPDLENVDDWSHWEHGPDNNPVSVDQTIKAPYMTQWLGVPLYCAMPAITTAAGGRIFTAMGHMAHHKREEPWLNTLIARNGYNGSFLWTRKLPDGYLVHRSAFIATDDTFYMIGENGTSCLQLDPESGDETGRIVLPRLRGEWKWMALDDGVLYVLLGQEKDPPQTTIVRAQETHWSWMELSSGYYEERIPWGFGDTIAAYDLNTKKVLWSHREDSPIDSRGMALGGGKVYLYCPGDRLVSLYGKTGEICWSNDDSKIQRMIGEPGKGLISTPGFRTVCMCVYTPEALVYQGQTLMNVVAISPEDGEFLWRRRKTTSNPNIIYADGVLIGGIGLQGQTLLIDPSTGEEERNIGFIKGGCARLTATPDSFFSRGNHDGLGRYDRIAKETLYNAAFRPSCNDGIIGANGMLYTGPWLCDCNLSLMGQIALCSAGDFQFDYEATEEERLEIFVQDTESIANFPVSQDDWYTYRGDNNRSGSTPVLLPEQACRLWEYAPERPFKPTAPVAVGGMFYIGGDDGKLRAFDSASGFLKWTFLTAGPILQPPTIQNNRIYLGSADGYIYTLEAATGRLLWRFRGAPVERRIPMYGSLCSTWPVHSGILAENGTIYAAAGNIDYDGTYLYALDGITGKIQWQNNRSGHLDPELRKGISAQGTLTSLGDCLCMPGGNVVSPAVYDLNTGDYLGLPPGTGEPASNRGEEIGVFDEGYLILGGRLRFSAANNIVNPGHFDIVAFDADGKPVTKHTINQGKIPPVWNDDIVVCVDGRCRPPRAFRKDAYRSFLKETKPTELPVREWTAEELGGLDVLSLALAPNATIAVCEYPRRGEIEMGTMVFALDNQDGHVLWQQPLAYPSMPGGLLVDQKGRVIVLSPEGRIAGFAGGDELQAGYITDWKLAGPVPWNGQSKSGDETFGTPPQVDVAQAVHVEDKEYVWADCRTEHPNGMVDLVPVYGTGPNRAVYAFAYVEIELPEAQDLILKIGSNDGHACWLNGELVATCYDARGYEIDEDIEQAKGKKGVNRILFKSMNLGAAWAFSLRLADENGRPIKVKQVELGK